MDLTQLADLGEFIGGVAVVATLAYLAVQVRQNTSAVSMATYESISGGFNQVNGIVAADTTVAAVFSRGVTDPESLNEAEAVQFSYLMRCWTNRFHMLVRLYRLGAITKAEWDLNGAEAAQAFRTPGGLWFQAGNPFFQDLYDALEEFAGAEDTSNWGLDTGKTR